MSEQPSRAEERIFLVVVDESPEMQKALRYACRRAKRTGGRVALLYVMEPPEGQQWGGVVDLSLARVSITSAFQGESILLFGMFDPPGEIVVVVAGPSARQTVLRKQRFLGLWLNTGRQSFDDVPAYYAIAASQPLQRLLARGAGGEILSLEDRLSSVRSFGQRDHQDLIRFRLGLVEVKRR